MAIRLVVGLGNDDPKYARTPHNIGFWAVDLLAVRPKSGRKAENRDYVLYQEPFGIPGLQLVKPRSFMNVCGPNVRAALDDFHAAPSDALIVLDDFALEWGRLRFRKNGSAGGHNGLKSVIEALGTEDFPRLRVGIGPVPDGMDPKDFVLKPQPADRLRDLAAKAADGLEVALASGLDVAMNRFNAKEA